MEPCNFEELNNGGRLVIVWFACAAGTWFWLVKTGRWRNIVVDGPGMDDFFGGLFCLALMSCILWPGFIGHQCGFFQRLKTRIEAMSEENEESR